MNALQKLHLEYGGSLPDPERVAALENEIRKLRIINAVLMERVEREMDPRVDSAFSRLYQAIALESSVSKRTEALTALTRRLTHEIGERREAEAALHDAKAAAERANLSKTTFLAAASHDLSQPLNAARLFLGALAEQLPQGPAHALTDRIDAALDTMDHLLTALMDISKLDAGFLRAEITNFQLSPLLRTLFEEFRPQAASLGLELRLVETSAVLHTDRHLLERILRNLIGNAIRYTKEGRILLGVRRQKGHARIDVIDTGSGIPKDKFQSIFTEFHQLGNNPRSSEKGVGLGLAIVERVARLLGCPVEIDSVLGLGSRFSVRVPYGSDAAARAVASGPVQGSARVDFRTCLVVVVDHDRRLLEGMQSLLHSWNCRVLGYASTEQALADLDVCAQMPDIIIADYQLESGRCGVDAVAEIRARFASDIPALIIAADPSAAVRAELRAAGLAVLAKPLAPSRLRALMSHLLTAP
jgi:signal transduction histidine kinase